MAYTIIKSLGYIWVCIVWYVSLTPHPPDVSEIVWGDKWGHLIAYGWLMWWFGQTMASIPRLRLAVGFVAMGIGIEFIQGISGFRSLEIADMVADLIGVLIAWFMLLFHRTHLLAWLLSRSRY